MRVVATFLVTLLLVAACSAGSPQPDATSTTEAAALGSAANPVPPGEFAEVGVYEIRLTSLTVGEDEAVVSEYYENDPPPAGRTFPLIGIEVRFLGDENDRAHFTFDMTFTMESPDGSVVYERRQDGCGSIPDDIAYQGEVFPGDVITGNICRAVPREDLPDDLLVHLKYIHTRDDPGVWFEIPDAA